MRFKVGSQIFAMSSMLAFSGCASLFGPYVPLKTTYSSLPTEGHATVAEPADQAATVTMVQPEFDAGATPILEPVKPQLSLPQETPGQLPEQAAAQTVEDVPRLRPIAALTGLNSSEPSTSTTTPGNPFAVAEAAAEPPSPFPANEDTTPVNPFALAEAAADSQPVPPEQEVVPVVDEVVEIQVDSPTHTAFTTPPAEPQKQQPKKQRLRTGLIRQTSAEAAAMAVPASFAGNSNNAASQNATTFHPSVPRLPSGQPGCPIEAACGDGIPAVVQAYPDEYICDGGDRDFPVHYYGGQMQGLDTEDTVAEFKDHEGQNHVNPSNRVCIYAPRFGAVQTVTSLGVDVKIDKAAGARDVSGFGALEKRDGVGFSGSHSGAAGVGTRRSASGIETMIPAHQSAKTDSIVETAKVDQGLESKMTAGLRQIALSDVAELNIQIVGLLADVSETSPGISASTSQATQTYSTFRLEAVSGSDNSGRPGKVHIMKEASPQVAKPGDTITFRIHFRNTGDLNVHDVRIIDNLTPRLIYTDGSGQIQIANQSGGSLTAAPNKEGSHTLVFELDEPLQGGQTGTITFEAVVR